MRCELDDGSVRQVRTEAELLTALKQVGREGHIILGGDTSFIQAARSGAGFYLEYGEKGGLNTADDTLGMDETGEVLLAFFRGDESWKSRLRWTATSAGGSSGGGGDVGDRTAEGGPVGAGASAPGGEAPEDRDPGRRSERGLAETVADEAMRAMKRGAGRAIRQGLRRFIK